jgi:hypothetical protein
VLVGRRTALTRRFEHMMDDFRGALRRLDRSGGRAGGGRDRDTGVVR